MKIKSGYARAGAACASTLRNSSPHASKTKGTVLCPYCVCGFEFRLMVAHVDGRYICDRAAIPPIREIPNTTVAAPSA